MKPKFKPGDFVIRKGMENEICEVELIFYKDFDYFPSFYRVKSLHSNHYYMCSEFDLEKAQNKGKFKPGEFVTVDGFNGKFEIIAFEGFEHIIDDFVYKLRHIKTGDIVYGAESDMKSHFEGINEFAKARSKKAPLLIEEFEARIFHKKKPKKQIEHEKLIKKGNRAISDYLDLYNQFKDPKYLKQVKRIYKVLSKIPEWRNCK